MKSKHYILDDFLSSEDDICHVNRVTIHSTEQTYRQDHFYHDHDHPEIFWIEEGFGWHLINGEKQKLTKGSMVLMRPKDSHTFYAESYDNNITLTNIAFSQSVLNNLRNNYFSDSHNYFWTKNKFPFTTTLDDISLKRVSLQATRLFEKQVKTRLKLDFFLLFVFNILENNIQDATYSLTLPNWFQKAIKTWKTPEHFSKGIAGFSEIAGRSPDHINFTTKKYLNKTLSDVLNEARMRYAEIQLTITDASIKSIYSACGFTSKSHFYKIFKEHFNDSPSKYRKLHSPIQ